MQVSFYTDLKQNFTTQLIYFIGKYKKIKTAEALAEKNAAEAAEGDDKDVEKGTWRK